MISLNVASSHDGAIAWKCKEPYSLPVFHVTEKYEAICSLWWRHQIEIFSVLLTLCETSDAEFWCFLWSTPEQTVEQAIQTLVIWDAIALIMTSL